MIVDECINILTEAVKLNPMQFKKFSIKGQL